MTDESNQPEPPGDLVQPQVQPTAPVGRPCWVCGAPEASEEHVWPEWLQKYAANATGEYWMGIAGDPSSERRWTGAAFEHTSRVLCVPCNRRFGTELEGPAAQLIPAMFDGKPSRLDGADQRLLARWLQKTALMVSTTNRHEASVLPRAHYRDLNYTFDPPPMTTTWIGRIADPAHEVTLRAQRFSWSDPRIEIPRKAEGYAYVETVKDICAFSVVFDSRQSPESPEEDPPVLLGALSVGKLLRIWPPADHYGVPWPPPTSMMSAEVVEVLHSFVRQAAATGSRSLPEPS